jgi:ferredoxin
MKSWVRRDEGHRSNEFQLKVDWPECKGRGLCAELLPEIVHLDEFGYPVVRGAVTDQLRPHAMQALSACPHAALRLVSPPQAG